MTVAERVTGGGGYRRLLAASGVSAVGDGVRDTALPLLAFALLGDPFQVALVSAVNRLPWLLFALPAGALADRGDRRRLMILADLARAATLAAAAGLLLLKLLDVWALLAAAFLLGAGSVVSQCASFALLPDVAGGQRLERANGRLFGVQTLGRELTGRTLGGLLFTLARIAPLLVFGAVPLGAVAFGALAELDGPRAAFIAGGLLFGATAAVLRLLLPPAGDAPVTS